MKKIIKSAFMGILGLFAVNISSVFTGVSLSINFLSLIISAVLGIPGVISMLILGYIIK